VIWRYARLVRALDPRIAQIGLAYDPFGDGKTAVRAAVGHILRQSFRKQLENKPSISSRLQRAELYEHRGQENSRQAAAWPTITGAALEEIRSLIRVLLKGGGILGMLGLSSGPTHTRESSVERQSHRLKVSVAYIGTWQHRLAFAQDVNYPQITT